MKTMTKIKLINWHIFDNHTINIKNDTLITGENGHGKSTLLDAVNFVLSGSSGKFNQAANENTKRSVESYVRGKTGIEGKEYIRAQEHIISHIALEFHDRINNTYLTIGVVFEIPNMRRKYGTFYHITDSKIEEDYYIDENMTLGLSQFKQKVESKGKTINIFEKKREINNMIKSTLGLSNDKYFELLPKALAFKPINEVSKFVYDFLLPEDKVDIESLQTNIFSYRHIEKLLKTEEEKLDHLLPINYLGLSYNENIVKLKILSNLQHYFEYEKSMYNLQDAEEKLILYNNDYNNLNGKDSIIKTKLFKLKQELKELQSNDVSKLISSSESKLNEELQKQNEINNRIKALINLIQSEEEIARKLNLEFNFSKHINNNSYEKLTEVLSNYDDNFEKLKKQLIIEQSELEKQIHINKEASFINDEEIKKLESNKFTYSNQVESLLSILRKELPIAFNKQDIDIRPLCELLDIEDANYEWTNAIEGYLNTQRFDIIVEPIYFQKALSIYDKHKFEKHIHGVGLINTNKLKNYENKPNSLATKVKGLNEYARQAINMIMGRVICVDDVADLDKHNNAITVSGMTYSKNTARQINEKIWQKPYIGQKAKKIQLDNAKNKKVMLANEFNYYLNEKNKVDNKLAYAKNSKISQILSTPNLFRKKEMLENSIKNITKELEILKSDPQWLEIEDLINVKAALIKNVEHEQTKITKEMVTIENYIKDYTLKVPDLIQQTKELKEEYEELEDLSLYNLEIENQKNDLKEKFSNSHYQIGVEINKRSRALENISNKEQVKIEAKMNEYNQKYDNGMLIPSINNLDTYIDLYNVIYSRNIIEYKDQAQLALAECEKSFKEDFLSKLRQKIQSAQEGFIQLNKTLKTKPFGSEKEVYTFTYSSSKNPDFKDYYTIIQSSQDYEAKSLLTDALSDKNQILLRTLFQKLTAEDKTEAQIKRISEYTDYRKYMSYDIKITNRNDETYYFSKVNKEKSGGETQTPFYVIIASSFQQLLDVSKRNRSSACVVMFDEAFNNMDDARIEAMMEYYKELNIQLLIAVPPARLVNIISHVDTTLTLIKSNNTVVINPYMTLLKEDVNEEL